MNARWEKSANAAATIESIRLDWRARQRVLAEGQRPIGQRESFHLRGVGRAARGSIVLTVQQAMAALGPAPRGIP